MQQSCYLLKDFIMYVLYIMYAICSRASVETWKQLMVAWSEVLSGEGRRKVVVETREGHGWSVYEGESELRIYWFCYLFSSLSYYPNL